MRLTILISALLIANECAAEFSARGNIGLQNRLFYETAIADEQQNNTLSASIETEFFWENTQRNHSLSFTPFLRLDQHDNERNHADIREASWLYIKDNIELRIGARQVFWGKTEFQHLVDIINQRDNVEDIDGEDKLGQPMINLSIVKNYGIFEGFILPYFRERTFPGEEGRLRFPLLIDTDNPQYQSSDKEKHIDYALRWSHYIGIFDVGLSWFKGTGREPLFIPEITANNDVQLIPYYEQIQQWSVDGQATIDSWLIKWEMLYREGKEENFFASQSGIEYTLYGLIQQADLGVLVEYAWDERGTHALSIFQNDVFIGARLAFNDVQSSELLAGIGYDLDFDAHNLVIEGSRRFGENIKGSLDLRIFNSDEPMDLSYAFRQDDHLQLTVQYFF